MRHEITLTNGAKITTTQRWAWYEVCKAWWITRKYGVWTMRTLVSRQEIAEIR